MRVSTQEVGLGFTDTPIDFHGTVWDLFSLSLLRAFVMLNPMQICLLFTEHVFKAQIFFGVFAFLKSLEYVYFPWTHLIFFWSLPCVISDKLCTRIFML